MKYMFIVQGEGRGHLTQAIALAQLLRRAGHDVIEVMVGKNPNRVLPAFFEEKIGCRVQTFDSPSFDYGKGSKRGHLTKTIIVNTTPRMLARWQKSINAISHSIGKAKPDVVVNFYEILVGMTGLVHRLNVPIISIGHQFLVDHPGYAHRSHSEGQFALRLNNLLCSLGTTKTLALSFYPLKDDYHRRMAVVPPLLRREVFEIEPRNEGYILGYLLNPGYADEVREWHAKHPETPLHIFWDKKDAPETLEIDKGLTFHRIHDSKFLDLMGGCAGYATTAGFESVCEAMYLGKPALMIPVHLEQEINAADAVGIGAGIASKSFDLSALTDLIPHYKADTESFRRWVGQAEELMLRHLTTLV